jgi:hypothetical protein
MIRSFAPPFTRAFYRGPIMPRLTPPREADKLASPFRGDSD